MSGTNKLWSSDIFPGMAEAATQRAARPTRAAPTPAMPAAAEEAAYLRYANPVLRLASDAGPQGIRRDDLAAMLADKLPDFDIDDLQTALNGLQARGLLEVAERDRVRGNHLYIPSSLGRAIGAG